MNRISYINNTNNKIEELNVIKKIINYTLKEEQVINAEFNVIFIDNDEIRRINKEYRGKDQVTDVISFAFEDNLDVVYDNYRLLGEIYISVDKAREQAVEYGHSYLREIAFLAVHGLLHLLGYDHMEKDEEEIMFKKQEAILNAFEIKRG